jgi:hypothetical protein
VSRVEWNAGPFLNDVTNEGKRRLTECVVLGTATAKEGMGISPSPPGGYPGVDLGTLIQNITFEVDDGPEGPVGRFGVLERTSGGKELEYALHLEMGTKNMAPRPWLTLTINQCTPQWQRILGVK